MLRHAILETAQVWPKHPTPSPPKPPCGAFPRSLAQTKSLLELLIVTKPPAWKDFECQVSSQTEIVPNLNSPVLQQMCKYTLSWSTGAFVRSGVPPAPQHLPGEARWLQVPAVEFQHTPKKGALPSPRDPLGGLAKHGDKPVSYSWANLEGI
ncbi:hypothetical protein H1C71_000198 [Ictidomys tridecemlineatus]|nr:hypothetical protein H1C71_000198 [Ictidomys tridecemlineatus]KAG3263924.1 hypothetical protein H1C71_000198 [Ictidomys tridecemlineatus]